MGDDRRDKKAREKRDGELAAEREVLIRNLREQQEEIYALKAQIAAQQRKTAADLVHDVLKKQGGEQAIEQHVIDKIRAEIAEDMATHKLWRCDSDEFESMENYTHKQFLKDRNGTLLRILQGIADESKAAAVNTLVDLTDLEKHHERSLTSAIASIYSLNNRYFYWAYGRAIALMTRLNSVSKYLGDVVAAGIAGARGSRQTTNILNNEAQKYKQSALDYMRLNHGTGVIRVLADNNAKSYTGVHQRALGATDEVHHVGVFTNMLALVTKPASTDALNIQCCSQLKPWGGLWKNRSDASKESIIDPTEEEREAFEAFVRERVGEGKKFHEVNKAKIAQEIKSRKENEEKAKKAREKKEKVSAVRKASGAPINDENAVNNENEIEVRVGIETEEDEEEATEQDKAQFERLKQGGTGRDPKLDGETKLPFEKWWCEKVCEGCETKYEISAKVCITCIDKDGNPTKGEEDHNANYNKPRKLPNKGDYRKVYDAVHVPVTRTRYPQELRNQRTKSKPSAGRNSGKTISFENTSSGHSRKRKTESSSSDESAIGDPDVDKRTQMIQLPHLNMNPGASQANKRAVLEELLKYGNVITNKNPRGTRHWLFVITDCGARAPLDADENRVIQLLGNGHEGAMNLDVVCDLLFPLFGDFYSKHLTNGDTDGFRKLLRSNGDNHKSIQALKEMALVVTATLWGEFVSEQAWMEHTVDTFLDIFLQDEQNPQRKLYGRVFVTDIVPSLLAFERALRTNRATLRSAARKKNLARIFARGRHIFSKLILAEQVMLYHCAPELIRKEALGQISFNGEAFDWIIENDNKTKKKLINADSEAAVDRADVAATHIDGIQAMLCREGGVKETKDEISRSRPLPDKSNDLIKAVAFLTVNESLTSSGDDKTERGILGEKIIQGAFCALEEEGTKRINSCWHQHVVQNKKIEDVTVEAKKILVCSEGEDVDNSALLPPPPKKKNTKHKVTAPEDGTNTTTPTTREALKNAPLTDRNV